MRNKEKTQEEIIFQKLNKIVVTRFSTQKVARAMRFLNKKIEDNNKDLIQLDIAYRKNIEDVLNIYENNKKDASHPIFTYCICVVPAWIENKINWDKNNIQKRYNAQQNINVGVGIALDALERNQNQKKSSFV